MRKVNVQYASSHLDELVKEAMRGEEVLVVGEEAAIVQLKPVDNGTKKVTDRVASKARREAVETLCRQFQELPDLDSRSAEEILGYDERGLF
jgi:antitoxin (DNA-binding transcriptional repressor) of toxin-antitoxin stability system